MMSCKKKWRKFRIVKGIVLLEMKEFGPSPEMVWSLVSNLHTLLYSTKIEGVSGLIGRNAFRKT